MNEQKPYVIVRVLYEKSHCQISIEKIQNFYTLEL